jgi:hypothetical protein
VVQFEIHKIQTAPIAGIKLSHQQLHRSGWRGIDRFALQRKHSEYTLVNSAEGSRSTILDLSGYSELPTADKTVELPKNQQSSLRQDLSSSDRNQSTPDSQRNRFGSGGRA